jgi:F-type H+-transporting ATPase subunit gamma
MRQLKDIAQEEQNMQMIVQLTNTFESLASMRISQIKNQVLEAQIFFNELWNIYIQIRVDKLFRFGRESNDVTTNKELVIVISSAGGFSGDIDHRLIATMLEQYDGNKQDIIVIGRHGTILLSQAGILYKKFFNLPEKDQNINVEPLIREIRQYKSTVVYYQTYVSLMTQDIRRIELQAAIWELSEHATPGTDIISESNYIFEPSAFDVVAHLERSMLQIALGQVIFDSKLAQYASRFRAMSVAHERADNSLADTKLLYNHTKRAIRDEQLKQIIIDLKKVPVV